MSIPVNIDPVVISLVSIGENPAQQMNVLNVVRFPLAIDSRYMDYSLLITTIAAIHGNHLVAVVSFNGVGASCTGAIALVQFRDHVALATTIHPLSLFSAFLFSLACNSVATGLMYVFPPAFDSAITGTHGNEALPIVLVILEADASIPFDVHPIILLLDTTIGTMRGLTSFASALIIQARTIANVPFSLHVAPHFLVALANATTPGLHAPGVAVLVPLPLATARAILFPVSSTTSHEQPMEVDESDSHWFSGGVEAMNVEEDV